VATPKKNPIAKSTAKPKAKAKAKAKAKPVATPAAKPRSPQRQAPSHEAIAARAYELSEARGDGDHVAHWFDAERELTKT
jgi:hypothetical protein